MALVPMPTSRTLIIDVVCSDTMPTVTLEEVVNKALVATHGTGTGFQVISVSEKGQYVP